MSAEVDVKVVHFFPQKHRCDAASGHDNVVRNVFTQVLVFDGLKPCVDLTADNAFDAFGLQAMIT